MTNLFFSMSDIGLTTVALAIAGALGLLLGSVQIRGVGLGIGGVLFAGIAVGHFGGLANIEFNPETLEF